MFDPAPCAATVTAVTDVHAAAMSRAMLRRHLNQSSEIAWQLLSILASQLRGANDMVFDVVFADVQTRLAKQLLQLGATFGRPCPDGIRIDHGLTQAELGQLCATARETINKALAAFVTRGWIGLDGKRIYLRDTEQLARRARAAMPINGQKTNRLQT